MIHRFLIPKTIKFSSTWSSWLLILAKHISYAVILHLASGLANLKILYIVNGALFYLFVVLSVMLVLAY